MMKQILIKPLTRNDFAPFGDVIEKDGAENFPINNGMCQRFHDLSAIEFTGPAARPLINIVKAKPYELPLELNMLERHPLGSQAFMPLTQNPFLVIAAEDEDGTPRLPKAFITQPGQGINFRANTWHGVLTALHEVCDFLVVDRGGEGDNVEEFFFTTPYLVAMPKSD